METSPAPVDNEGKTARLFEHAVGERAERRLSRAEALEYVRIVRAQLRRAETHTQTRRVA